MVKLSGMEARRPAQLSGGQRQRVALARALVVRPKVLLLDEPLGALDLKLREEMQVELKGLQRALGLTFVFVTHDQSEALSMADRVAVFNDGRIVQVGPPEEVYERPATRFVAGFVGSSNVLSALEAEALGGLARPSSLRPEKIALVTGAPPEGAHAVEATVVDVSYQGPVRRITARTPAGLVLTAAVSAGAAGEVERGGKVMLAVPPDALQPMEGEA
jgi:putative spermidine/putrescine transport system ATP-binding protein